MPHITLSINVLFGCRSHFHQQFSRKGIFSPPKMFGLPVAERRPHNREITQYPFEPCGYQIGRQHLGIYCPNRRALSRRKPSTIELTRADFVRLAKQTNKRAVPYVLQRAGINRLDLSLETSESDHIRIPKLG
jgi:hypothetical protein